MSVMNTDVYNISEVLLNLQKEYFEEQSEDTLALGMYGYTNAVFAKMMQNSIKVASEMSNEMFFTKARLDKNIIIHAIANNITDINAIPAKMDIILCLLENDYNKILDEQNLSSITIDRNCKFFIGDFEYHLDYDMIVSKTILENNVSVYTARYNMSVPNSLSNVEVPYLPSPYVVTYNGNTYIFIACHLRQVEVTSIYNKILTSDIIDNKTYEFEFENQLATFDVYARESGSTNRIRLIPVFEGTNIDNIDNYYCWYTYMDSSTIRVKFDNASYMPNINAEIETVVKTTHGYKGNFKYRDTIITTLDDTANYNYNGMQIAIMPAGDSKDGMDRKSIKELKRILPKESLSRGNITNVTDLNNYFNTLNTETTRMKFKEKVHNQFERTFYSYLLVKDDMANIVPTNTIDMYIKNSDFDLITNEDNPELKQYIFKQGCYIGYKKVEDKWMGYLLKDPTQEELDSYQFLYTIPFKAVINHSGPFISYYMTTTDDIYRLNFSYINDSAPLQFIASTIEWSRDSIINNDRYILSINLKQNIDVDMGIIKEVDGVTTCSIKLITIVYDNLGLPYRYMVGTLNDYINSEEKGYNYNFKFEFITPDVINEDNCIRIDNSYLIKGDGTHQYGYLQRKSNMDIYILNEFKDEEGNPVEYGRDDLDDYVNDLDGYTVTNKYNIINGLSFFENYSEIVSTKVTPVKILNEKTLETEDGFRLSGVPVVEYKYAQVKKNINKFINTINIRKAYIDSALKMLENQFGIDFKFFNTYGPAKVYTIDGSTKVSKVNLKLNYNLSLKKASDGYTRDYIIKFIKNYIENLDNSGDLHIGNLNTAIEKEYANSINYIEFRGFNEYDTSMQHLYYDEGDDINTVPEFACINIRDDGSSDIDIKIV